MEDNLAPALKSAADRASKEGMVARDRIVIGASAGGVSALRHMVAGLPSDLPAAIFITLHMFQRGELFLPDVLNAAGPLRACLARDGLPIEEGRIYVAPPDHHLLIAPEAVRLGHGPREGLQRPSINVMFRSAAASFGDRVAGVVLTGLLDDGASGLWEILQHGGVTVVQDPEEAAYRSMPESAVRGLNVQYILKLNEMAPLLTRLSMGERRESRTVPDSMTTGSTRTEASSALQACPECGGVMVLEKLGEIKEYVCHVGHRLGIQSMISDKADLVERAMWTALSQSEELVALLEQAQADGEPGFLAPEKTEIAARQADIVTLRAVLERNKLNPPRS